MRIHLAAAALLSLLLAACGGGSSSGSADSSSTPTNPANSSSSLQSSIASSENSQNESPENYSSENNSSISSVNSSESSNSSFSSNDSGESSANSENSVSSSSEDATSSESSSTSSVSVVFFEENFDLATAATFYSSYRQNSAGQSLYKKAGGTPIFSDGAMTLAGARITVGEAGNDLDLSKPYTISFDVVQASGSGKVQIFVDIASTSGDKIFNENANTLAVGQRFVLSSSVGTASSFIQIRAESSASLTIDNLVIEYTGAAGSSSSTSSTGSGGVSSSGDGNSSSSNSSVGVSSSSSSSSSAAPAPSIPPGTGGLSAACFELATNPNVNWRETALQTDQEIVECLSDSLGKPVGYGENARGGYDPNGNSKLTIIVKNHPDGKTVEEQINEAIADNEHNWIVFDKIEFAQPYEIGLYRLHCGNPQTASILNITESQCNDYRQWCADNHVTGEAQCLDQFFNHKLNNNSLSFMRNPVVGSNKTIDGRMSEVYFLFYGFMIGRDSSGVSTQKSTSVILTHLNFKGAGHTEDHYIDPDMIRNTGESQDIWIHKNTFDTTGDSAFDVKVGAFNITMSFNKIFDVKRAALHGSSDSRVINAQITTTMHHNAFVTRDNFYSITRNTGRRAPLIRRGTSHMFNNVFFNYRKEISSLRVGAQVLWEDNAVVINRINMEKSTVESSMNELLSQLIDMRDGHFRADGVYLWYSDAMCNLDESTRHQFNEAYGTVGDLNLAYTAPSQTAIAEHRLGAGQSLVDYVSATAGKYGELPFNSPLAGNSSYVLDLGKVLCQ